MEEGKSRYVEGLPLLDSAVVSFTKVLFESLSPRQIVVLRALPGLLPADNMTLFCEKLANSTISEPTLRRTIQKLRELGIVSCGDRNSKGRPLELTELGRIILGARGKLQ